MVVKRTAEGKRIRTFMMQGVITAVAQTPSGGVLVLARLIQDNITIIGAECISSCEVTDTALNTDGFVSSSCELSRVGIHSRDGTILKAHTVARWHGIFFAGDIMHTETAFFPEGFGIDIDDGEYLNLIGTNQNNSDDTLACYQNCIVYYVERPG